MDLYLSSALPAAFLIGLAYVGWRDLTELRIPDHATAPLAVLGLVWIVVEPSASWVVHLAAAAIGGATFVLIGRAYLALKGQEGLGLGDAKLVTVGGLWLGPDLAMAIATGTGIAVIATGVLILAERRFGSDPIPLGFYLGIGFSLFSVL